MRPGTGGEPVTVLQIPPNPSNRSSGGGMWRSDGLVQTDRCNGVRLWARHGASARAAGLRPGEREQHLSLRRCARSRCGCGGQYQQKLNSIPWSQ